MSELKEFWKILKDSDFKDMDIHKAFSRRCTPNACIELLSEIDEIKDVNDRLYSQIESMQNTRTQSQWISDQLAPALNKCFKSKIGCDGMLMVAVDDYNELVDLINKAASPKEQGQ